VGSATILTRKGVMIIVRVFTKIIKAEIYWLILGIPTKASVRIIKPLQEITKANNKQF